jgi:hypothetical protein
MEDSSRQEVVRILPDLPPKKQDSAPVLRGRILQVSIPPVTKGGNKNVVMVG